MSSKGHKLIFHGSTCEKKKVSIKLVAKCIRMVHKGKQRTSCLLV